MNVKSWRCDYQGHRIDVELGLERARLYLDGQLANDAPGLLFHLLSPAIDLSGTIRTAEGTSTLVQAFVRRPGLRLPLLQCQVWLDSVFYLRPEAVEDMEIVSFLLEGIVKASLGAVGGALAGAIAGLGSGATGDQIAAVTGAFIGAVVGASVGLGGHTTFPPQLSEDARLFRYVYGQHPEPGDDNRPHPD
jgi:hypothetical protein